MGGLSFAFPSGFGQWCSFKDHPKKGVPQNKDTTKDEPWSELPFVELADWSMVSGGLGRREGGGGTPNKVLVGA